MNAARPVAADPSTETVDRPPREIADALCAPPARTAATRPHAGDERYLVIEEIGRGGMGVVLRAYDPRLKREVALKQVRPDELSAETQARLLREAVAMAKLSHPNVVAIYDVDVRDNHVMIAMEYVRGATLKDWLRVPRPWRHVLAVFTAAGRGLAAAHAAGVLHRDFKPANVLIDPAERPRVGDFGLARAQAAGAETSTASAAGDSQEYASHVTRAGSVLGTPRYMAPEQYGNDPLTPAADQYAFCVALWEALHGEPPFRGFLDGVLEEKRAGAPPWPTNKPLPPAIRNAIVRGLAPDPAERWPSMDALLEALSRDPGAHRRWWGGAALAAVTLPAFAWAVYRGNIALRCTGARAQIAEVWSPERRASVRDAFEATGVASAPFLWRKATSRLDEYSAAWAAMHTQTCEATTVRGEQAPQVMDLRMGCLHRAKVDLRAITDALIDADAQIVGNAIEVVATLPDLARCSDLAALQSEVAPPAPADAGAVEAVRVEIASITVLREAGKYGDAVRRAEALAARADALSYRPLQAEVQIELALVLEELNRYPEAEAAFKRAFRSALASKQWREAEVAASWLVHVTGSSQARPAEGFAYAETAKVILQLTGNPHSVDLHSHLATVLHTVGRNREAEVEQREAIAIASATSGERSLALALQRENLAVMLMGQGRHEEAESEVRWALAVREDQLGLEHPKVARSLYDLGLALNDQGRYEEAEQTLRRAVAVGEKALGPDHLDVGLARGNLAIALIAQERDSEAVAEYQAALQIKSKVLGPEHPLTATNRSSLASALIGLGYDAEAEQHLRAALAAEEKNLGVGHLDTARTRSRFAHLLAMRGKYRESELESRKSIAVLQRELGDPSEMAVALSSLASVRKELGALGEAELEVRRAIALMATYRDGKHPLLPNLRSFLGKVLEADGRLREAEAEHRAALALQIEILGPEHWLISRLRGRLAGVLRMKRRFAEAEAEYQLALANLEPMQELKSVELSYGLGQTLLEWGKTQAALALFERVWTRWKEDKRLRAPVRAALAFGLARASWATDRARARELAREAQRLYETIPEGHRRERNELQAWVRSHGQE